MRRLVAIGASAGGFQALTQILGRLPLDFAGSLAIVQHRRPDESSLLRELLAQRCPLPVTEPYHDTPLRPGHVYIAPPDYHLLIEPGALALSVDAPINMSRPSIDVLFESAASSYRQRAARLHEVQAPLIVQDPATATAPECPTAALARVPTALVLPVSEIAAHLVTLCGRSRA